MSLALVIKSGSASVPSSFSCDGFSSNESLKKFPPEGQEIEKVFLFLDINKQTKKKPHTLLAQRSDELGMCLWQ